LRLQLRLVPHVQPLTLIALPVVTPTHALLALAAEPLMENFVVVVTSIILPQVQAVLLAQPSMLPVLLVTPMHALPALVARLFLGNIAVVAMNIIIPPLQLVLLVQLWIVPVLPVLMKILAPHVVAERFPKEDAAA